MLDTRGPDSPPQSPLRHNDADLAALSQDADRQALEALQSLGTVEFSGVKLDMGNGHEERRIKPRNDMVYDRVTVELQQTMATSFALHQPVLIEGGSSLGKTTAAEDMAAKLGWSYYYTNNDGTTDVRSLMGDLAPNTNRKDPDRDPEYIYEPGPIAGAILEAARGNKVMLVIDEYNTTPGDILVRIHEVLDAYNSNGQVNLKENYNQVVQMVKDNLHIVALQNPPSADYPSRKLLDPAQIRRWNYVKREDELPRDAMEQYVTGLAGNKWDQLPVAEAEKNQLLARFIEFHYKAVEALKSGAIGSRKSQPQRFTFDHRAEPRRIIEFVQHFPSQDLSLAIQNAITYYYANKLLDPGDKAKITHLMAETFGSSLATPRRPVPATRPSTDARLPTHPALPAAPANPLTAPAPDSRRLPLGTPPPAPAAPRLPVPETASPEAQVYRPDHDRAVVNQLVGLNQGGHMGAAELAQRLAGLPASDILDARRSELMAVATIGQMIAGDASEQAWTIREELFNQKRFVELGESLVGLDDSRTHQLRTAIIEESSRFLDAYRADRSNSDLYSRAARLTDAAMISLAGIDSPGAWDIRNDSHLAVYSGPDAKLLSIMGLDSPEAWDFRSRHQAKSSPYIEAVTLAGLGSDDAWSARYSILARTDLDLTSRAAFTALSLAYLDAPQAHELRNVLMGRTTDISQLDLDVVGRQVRATIQAEVGNGTLRIDNAVALASLRGVYDTQSLSLVQQLSAGLQPNQLAYALAPDWVAAAVARARREAGTPPRP